MRLLTLLIAAVCVLSSLACAPSPRSRRDEILLRMAAEEASRVGSVKLRLKQQLHIAEIQIHRNAYSGAKLSLARAWETLEAGQEKIDPHTRLAGWVSISELSRGADDPETAAEACREARDALLNLPEEDQRCQYVLDLAHEIRAVFGRSRAVDLVVQAGPWARQINPQSDRREVYVAFADRLFDYEAYEPGREILAQDPESYWRSDTLVKLSRGEVKGKWIGKQLDYQNSFNSSENVLQLPTDR